MPNHSEMKKICEIMEENHRITYALAQYLNFTPRMLDEDTVKNFANECDIDLECAFRVLFCAACGLDTADNKNDRRLEREYFTRDLHSLDPTVYAANPYYQRIRIQPQKLGRWELRESYYAPFEPFVCGHLRVTADFREIAQIGYFKERFSFPAVLEDGIEWMTITPNEIETMKDPIATARGRVLTLGLGLGYYAFMVSEKDEVSEITVVEKDESVIELFTKVILPQFPHREKVRIIHADALDYMEKTAPQEGYDFIFADLWHDQSDGLPLYLRLRRAEANFDGNTEFSYWIEPTILSSIRHMVLDRLNSIKNESPSISLSELLTDSYLKSLAPKLKPIK